MRFLFIVGFLLFMSCVERDPVDETGPVSLELAWQQVSPVFASGETRFGVSRDFSLPASLPCGFTVIWSVSSNPWVTAAGRVTQPAAGGTNGHCLLTAALYCGSLVTNRTFVLTIPPVGDPKDGDPDPLDPNLLLVKSAGDGYWMGHASLLNSTPTNYTHFTYDFYMARYKTTWSEYLQFLAENPAEHDPRDEFVGSHAWVETHLQYPVLYVSWFDAIRYCNWKSRKAGLPVAYRIQGVHQMVSNVQLLDGSGQPTTNILDVVGYRLPTEAEWEYAAREKGTGPANQFSGLLTQYTYYMNSLGSSSAVDFYRPNALGLYDMSGNGSEWCLDKYTAYTAGSTTNRLIFSQPFQYATCRVLRNALPHSDPGGSGIYTDLFRTGYRWNSIWQHQVKLKYVGGPHTYFSIRVVRRFLP